MTLPNFIVIGAAKCGTTSLHDYLGQHPEIFMCPIKEPRFFAFDGDRPSFKGPGSAVTNATSVFELSRYEALFDGVSSERAVGEVSPRYLATEKAAESMRKHVPDAKLIAMLRNPADRAYSAYMMKVRDGLETETFADALRLESQRIADGWAWGQYAYSSYYHDRLRPYYDRFPRGRIQVYLLEEFVRQPLKTMQDMFRFLSIDAGFEPDLGKRHNESGVIRNRLTRMLWHKSGWLRDLVRPYYSAKLRHAAFQAVIRRLEKRPMPDDVRRELMEQFAPDIEKLESLLGRDLDIWRGRPA